MAAIAQINDNIEQLCLQYCEGDASPSILDAMADTAMEWAATRKGADRLHVVTRHHIHTALAMMTRVEETPRDTILAAQPEYIHTFSGPGSFRKPVKWEGQEHEPFWMSNIDRQRMLAAVQLAHCCARVRRDCEMPDYAYRALSDQDLAKFGPVLGYNGDATDENPDLKAALAADDIDYPPDKFLIHDAINPADDAPYKRTNTAIQFADLADRRHQADGNLSDFTKIALVGHGPDFIRYFGYHNKTATPADRNREFWGYAVSNQPVIEHDHSVVQVRAKHLAEELKRLALYGENGDLDLDMSQYKFKNCA